MNTISEKEQSLQARLTALTTRIHDGELALHSMEDVEETQRRSAAWQFGRARQLVVSYHDRLDTFTEAELDVVESTIDLAQKHVDSGFGILNR